MIRRCAIFMGLGLQLLWSSPPSFQDIRDSVLYRFDAIEDYSVNIKISVEMTGFRMPRKKLKMYYKKPDQMKIETLGFAIVPKTGLGGNPKEFFNMLEKVTDIHSLNINDSNQWKISGRVNVDSLEIPVKIGDNEIPEITMELFVDVRYWAITRVVVFLDSQNVFLIETEYEKMDGMFLPSRTEFKLGIKGISEWTTHDPFGGPASDKDDFEEIAGAAGIDIEKDEFVGRVSMEFSNYKVNQGLDDSIFEE